MWDRWGIEPSPPKPMTGAQAKAKLARLKLKMLQGDTDASVEHRQLREAIEKEVARRKVVAAEEGAEVDKAKRDVAIMRGELEDAHAELVEANASRGRLLDAARQERPEEPGPEPMIPCEGRKFAICVSLPFMLAPVLAGVMVTYWGTRFGFSPYMEGVVVFCVLVAQIVLALWVYLFATRKRK